MRKLGFRRAFSVYFLWKSLKFRNCGAFNAFSTFPSDMNFANLKIEITRVTFTRLTSIGTFYMVGENRIEVRGHLMTTRVDVDRGIEGPNVESFFDPSFDPVTFMRQDGLIFFAKVVAVVTGMLQHCRLILPKSIGRGGCVFLEAGSCSPFSFAYVNTWAWLMVNACTWLVVHNANFILFVQFVFRFN